MRIGRTLPPAATPITPAMILGGLLGLMHRDGELMRLTRTLKTHFQAAECCLVASGKAALTLALQALQDRHPERNQVLIPAYTCYSVPSAVVRAGLQVQIADIDPETFDYDFHRLGRNLRNRNLLAVVACHMFGRPADIPRLRNLLEDSQVAVIEDAAQAFGSTAGVTPLGTAGDIGVFSLGRGKALSTVAGGIVITKDPELAGRLRSRYAALPAAPAAAPLALLGYALALLLLQRPLFYWLPSLLPWLRLGETLFDPGFAMQRMSAFQAGMARDWQLNLSRFRALRRQRIDQWLSCLELADQPQLSAREAELADWLRLPLVVGSETERNQLLQFSRRLGLGLAASYPDAVSGIGGLESKFHPEDDRNARWLARHLLTLPLHPYVSAADIRRIGRLLRETLPQHRPVCPPRPNTSAASWRNVWDL